MKLANEYWNQISSYEKCVEQKIIPGIIADARNRGYLLKEEFITIGCWKSTRPKPRYQQNSEDDVKCLTKVALSPDSSRKDALAALDTLNGVALRTATAILHWFRDDTPILDMRVVRALDGKFSKISSNWENIELYQEVADLIIRETRRVGVDLRTMDRALWTWDKLH
ncbi:MAG: hypothetical protein Tsb008_15370 [Rhodothalassiaceae bacterium]